MNAKCSVNVCRGSRDWSPCRRSATVLGDDGRLFCTQHSQKQKRRAVEGARYRATLDANTRRYAAAAELKGWDGTVGAVRALVEAAHRIVAVYEDDRTVEDMLDWMDGFNDAARDMQDALAPFEGAQ